MQPAEPSVHPFPLSLLLALLPGGRDADRGSCVWEPEGSYGVRRECAFLQKWGSCWREQRGIFLSDLLRIPSQVISLYTRLGGEKSIKSGLQWPRPLADYNPLTALQRGRRGPAPVRVIGAVRGAVQRARV